MPRGLDEIHGVIVVFLNAGRHGQNIRIKYNFFRSDAGLLGKDPVRSPADLQLSRERIRLAFFIKRHHHHGRAVPPDQTRTLPESFFTLFQANRIDDAPALNALQAGFNHFPIRAVDHDRHARDVGLRGDVVQKSRHGLLGIEHGLVHVDVDDLRAVFDLLASHRQRGFVLAAEDQLGKTRRAGDVRAFADIDEAGIRPKYQRLKAAEARVALRFGQDMRRESSHRFRDGLDVSRRSSAAAAGDIQPSIGGKFVQVRGHRFRRLIEPAKCVGKTRVRVATDVDRRQV